MIHIPDAETVSTGELNSTDERYHHGDLRRALIAAALTLLTEKQDWSFSLREVARRAGVSHNAPYNHFSSKQELLAAVAAAGYDLLRAQMQAAMAQVDTPSAALKAVEIAYVLFGVGNPAHYRLMFGTALTTVKSGLPPTVCEAAAAAKELLRDIIRQGAAGGVFAVSPTSTEALDTVVLSAWSLVHGLTMLFIDGLSDAEPTPEPFTSAERITKHVTQLLLDGITT